MSSFPAWNELGAVRSLSIRSYCSYIFMVCNKWFLLRMKEDAPILPLCHKKFDSPESISDIEIVIHLHISSLSIILQKSSLALGHNFPTKTQSIAIYSHG